MRAAAVTAFVLPVLAISALVAAAEPAPRTNLVKAELLADTSTIKPGEPFKVGVRFKIEPSWHIYWINPGESGQATTLEWQFPEGYKVGHVEYPVPDNIPLPGGVKCYGYSDQVMLMATVTPPTDAQPGTEVPFSVKATWLVCADVCIPGKKALNGKLTVADHAIPANEDVFTQWNGRLPVRDLARLKGVVKGAKWSQPNGNGPVELVVSWDNQPPANIEWFVGTPESVLLKDAKASTSGSESKFTFTPTPSPDEIIKAPVVVAFTDAAGKRQGVEFSFKIGKTPAAPKGQAADLRIDPR
jgi:thiol:disulfide interchange protein DsbD